MESNIIVETIENVRPPSGDSSVTIKHMGDSVYEVRYMLKEQGASIKKISRDEYVALSTGELKEFTHSAETRADNIMSVSRSLKMLRDIINCNVINYKQCIWLTMTYAENMRNPERLYSDMDKFTKRIRYYLEKNRMPAMEYIYCIEPQARGAFHAHCILIFKAEKAPYIPNKDMAQIWGHGFTKTKSLKDATNPGLYFTAYLADMEYRDAIRHGDVKSKDVKTVIIDNEDGSKTSKAIVKGARLKLYPAGMRIFRVSRGIKRPVITQCTENEAMQIIGEAPLVYEKTKKISSGEDDSVINIINYRTYNRKEKKKEQP